MSSLLDFLVGGWFGLLPCLCGGFAPGQCVTWRTLSVCTHVVEVGVVIHRLKLAGVGLVLWLLGYYRVGGYIGTDRLRVCLVLMVGVITWCMPPDNSTRGP